MRRRRCCYCNFEEGGEGEECGQEKEEEDER